MNQSHSLPRRWQDIPKVGRNNGKIEFVEIGLWIKHGFKTRDNAIGEFSNRETHIAVFIRFQPVPLNENIEQNHCVSQAALEVIPTRDEPPHYGLTFMAARMKMVGGELSITSEVGVGTIVTLSGPTSLPGEGEGFHAPRAR